MLLNFEVVDNLFSVGFPVVSGNQGERSTRVEDGVNLLVGGLASREVGHGIGSESEVAILSFDDVCSESNGFDHRRPVKVLLEVNIKSCIQVRILHVSRDGVSEINEGSASILLGLGS